jgi:predicted HicB family RNase H-like nuclease
MADKTVEISEDMFNILQQKAEKEGISIKDFVERSIRYRVHSMNEEEVNSKGG